jgi:hypothetical protein
VWDASTEESFRVPTLKSTSGIFDVNAPCYEKHEFGVLLGDKSKSGAVKKRGEQTAAGAFGATVRLRRYAMLNSISRQI